MQVARAYDENMSMLHDMAGSLADTYRPFAKDFDRGVTHIALPGGNTRSALRKFGEPLPCLCVTVIS